MSPAGDSDGIEMRVRTWVSLRARPTIPPVYARLSNGIALVFLANGAMARIDGGDPGDEDDGR